VDEGVPDDALYEALRLGSGRALRLLAERHDPAMRRVALLYVSTGPAVDALVRRTWATALPGLDMFTWHTTFRAWLYGILVTAGRGVAVRPDVAPPPTGRAGDGREPLPWATLPWSRNGEEAVAAAAAGLSRMALREREVLWFRHAEGWPDREVCDALGLTGEEYGTLRTSSEAGLVAAVARQLGAPPPSSGDAEAASAALMTALRPAPGRTPEGEVLRALRRWRAERGLTVWHRVRARWRLHGRGPARD
jgi:DNA-directed RNA polymerase specialized sigma24 family protein